MLSANGAVVNRAVCFLNHFLMDIKPEIGVCLNHADPGQVRHLENLARHLKLPIFSDPAASYSFILTLNNGRLELQKAGPARSSPLFVDFLSGPGYYRFVHNRTINQPLARAVGIKSGYRPHVLDATAGFGQDGFVLASLGCTVTMIERSPIIWALLEDGVSRAGHDDRLRQIFSQRISLHLGDSREFIEATDANFETIYLDPMYPASTRSPLNKQKMRLLREVVGSDTDASPLLEAALHRAARRVTVKRPAKAEALTAREPSFSISARSSRYDVYLTPYL